jgi:hypothetical protein
MNHIVIRSLAIAFTIVSSVLSIAKAEDHVEASKFGPELHRRGYPTSVALADAISEFNERASQSEVGREQPPLRDDEVVGALLVADPPGGKRSNAEDRAWIKMAEQRLLPPGSYLRFSAGQVFEAPNGKGIVEVVTWNIFLVFGLEKNPVRSGV